MGPRPRFYQVTIASGEQPWGAARTDRQISLKARRRLKNGLGQAGEHPVPILAVEKAATVSRLGLASGFDGATSSRAGYAQGLADIGDRAALVVVACPGYHHLAGVAEGSGLRASAPRPGASLARWGELMTCTV